MLFIIDMQNEYIDPGSEKYIKDAEKLIPGITQKIKDYEKNEDMIFYTRDINLLVDYQGQMEKEDNIENVNNEKTIKETENKLSPEGKVGTKPYGELRDLLERHTEIKKTYYAIPPERLLEIQEIFKDKKHVIDNIEFVGVETNICVLANAICVQSAFPEATIIVDSKLCKAKDENNHKYALTTMESLGMKVRR